MVLIATSEISINCRHVPLQYFTFLHFQAGMLSPAEVVFSFSKIQEKCKVLDEELEKSDKRNNECEVHLAEVLRLMDKASAERDAYAALIDKEQKISEQAMRRTMLGKWEMGKMEQTITVTKYLLIINRVVIISMDFSNTKSKLQLI